MPSEVDLNGFLSTALSVGKACLEMREPLIVHHLDCDGISSGALVAAARRSKGLPFRTQVLKRVDEEGLKLVAGMSEELIFVDLGASSLDLLEKHLQGKKVIVIDHHPPATDRVGKEWVGACKANPHFFGFDGAYDASGASTAYFCFRDLDDALLNELGVVGAVGDMQDQRGFVGLNNIMLEDGVARGSIFSTRDLKLFGRVSRPLVWFLAYCTEPFLPGLSGDEKACARFLEENKIPFQRDGKWLCYYDLNVFERKQLTSALITHCLREGLPQDAVKSLIGDVYIFLNEPNNCELRDAYEFGTILNACGRHDAAELGVSVCLHEEGSLDKARLLLQEHKRAISTGISFAQKNTVDLGAFFFLDARGVIPDTVIGTVAGSFLGSCPDRSKPIIAFSLDEKNWVKVSSRGTRELVEAGLDLGIVMKKASAAVESDVAGGHSIAAGSAFTPTKENELIFLKKCKEVIEVQLEFIKARK